MELVLSISLIPVIVLTTIIVFKTNASIMFLAGCAGLVLLSSLDPVVVSTAGSVLPSEGEGYVRLAVVLLSVVFAGALNKQSVHGVKLVPHVLVGLLLSVLLLLVLPETTGLSWLQTLASQSLWQDIKEFQALVVAIGFSLSLILLKQKAHHPHKKHSH
jgi:hypothetical protein